ncbi:methyltransferase family protein [Celeribacter sp.]|uniref:methyltransferase family protein n=1 Tax=Celeribacter sp. TaxID=1890673 RepID=UPI003A9567A4
MSILAWLVSAGYVAGFLALTAALARRGGQKLWLFDAGQAGAAWGFRIAFAILVLWPVVTRAGGAPIWIVPAAVSAAFALYAQAYMGRSWRIGTKEGAIGEIVTGGPFRLSRNPVFVGQIALSWFLTPLVGLPMAVAAVIMTASAVMQVRSEEVVLGQNADWRRYAETTPRWIWRI